jgi:transposase-like protein/transposase
MQRKGSEAQKGSHDLTVYLTPIAELLLSVNDHPLPQCPACGTKRIYSLRRNKQAQATSLPVYCCAACKKQFRRTTGTPLSRIVRRNQILPFILLLSQSQTFTLASEQLGLDYRSVVSWTKQFRRWLVHLDPSGQMAAKVKLGTTTDLNRLSCPACLKTACLIHLSFHNTGTSAKNQLQCTACLQVTEVRRRNGADKRPDTRWREAQPSHPKKQVRIRKKHRDIALLEAGITAMSEEGHSAPEIAAAFQTEVNTVMRIIEQKQLIGRSTSYGTRKTRQRMIPEIGETNTNEILRRRRDGETYQSLARAFGISARSIRKIVSQEG